MSNNPSPNYDEAKVPTYDLPDLLNDCDTGSWPAERARILDLFQRYVYGRVPDVAWELAVTDRREQTQAMGGLAIRSEIELTLRSARGELSATVLATIPRRDHPVPALLGCNFAGNHTTTPDPWVSLTPNKVPNRRDEMVMGPMASEAGRGCLSRRWAMADAIAQGLAVVTVYSGDFDFDGDDSFAGGVHALLQDPAERDESSWGTIAAWSWGLSRALDALIEAEPLIDATRVGTIGHSRMGKTALWAAAQDERFALAISNNSGCTGAAISRRCFGERLHDINGRYPHWFAAAYHRYNHCEHELPIDQHQLLALLAPRPVYVGSASGDAWADPRGEFAACQAATPIYELYGKQGIKPEDIPSENVSLGDQVAYHIRPGSHDLLPQDWHHYNAFAVRHLCS